LTRRRDPKRRRTTPPLWRTWRNDKDEADDEEAEGAGYQGW